MDVGLEPGKEIQDLRSPSTPGAETSKRLSAGRSLRFKRGSENRGVGDPAWKPEENEPSDFGVWK